MDDPDSRLSGSPDLDAGIFYVRMEIDGQAKLSKCCLCVTCYAMIPVKAIDGHAEWHEHMDFRHWSLREATSRPRGDQS